MKNVIKKVGSLVYKTIFILLILIVIVILLSTFNLPGNIKLFTVQTGSMEPTIRKGSIVIIKPSSSYIKDDVITVVDPNNSKISVTHRIFNIETIDGKTVYVTKGDANNTTDLELRLKENILGKVLFSIPVIGYVISFAKTREGLIILIILPSILIVLSELINIRDETKRLLDERRKRKLSLGEKVEVGIGEEELKVEKWYGNLINKIKEKFKLLARRK